MCARHQCQEPLQGRTKSVKRQSPAAHAFEGYMWSSPALAGIYLWVNGHGLLPIIAGARFIGLPRKQAVHQL